MGKQQEDRLMKRNEELRDLLEDLFTQIQEIREDFISALDDLEDTIAESCPR